MKRPPTPSGAREAKEEERIKLPKMDALNHTVTKAKVLEQALAYQNPEGRKWIRIGRADSYQSSSNAVEAWLLEGSPPRGFVLFWINHGIAVRLDDWGKRLKTFRPSWDE